MLVDSFPLVPLVIVIVIVIRKRTINGLALVHMIKVTSTGSTPKWFELLYMLYVGDSAGPVAVNAIGTQLHYLILTDSGLTQWRLTVLVSQSRGNRGGEEKDPWITARFIIPLVHMIKVTSTGSTPQWFELLYMLYVGDSACPVAVNAIGTQLHYLILTDSGLTQWCLTVLVSQSRGNRGGEEKDP